MHALDSLSLPRTVGIVVKCDQSLKHILPVVIQSLNALNPSGQYTGRLVNINILASTL